MTEQPIETNDKYPWNDTVRTLLIAVVPAVMVLVLFQSKAAAVFVMITLWYCRTWQDLRILLVIGLIAMTLRSFAFEPFNIPSGSMKSTLLIGDYLFVSKYSYGYSRYSFPLGLPLFKGRIFEAHQPERGDVVVFREPPNPRIDFIKRIIGLPGDHIQLKGGVVYINGEPLKRQWLDSFADDEDKNHIMSVSRYAETLPEGKVITILKQAANTMPVDSTHTADDTPVYQVPPGYYFMMGDNRDHSFDSRFPGGIGYVPEENIIGRAEVIWFSTDGTAQWLNPFSWFTAMRFGRFFKHID